MNSIEYQWNLINNGKNKTEETELINLYVSELNISAALAKVILNRGFLTLDSAYKFLYPSLSDLHNPKLLPDYHKAVDKILEAKEQKQKIFIHGDYDVDGVSSTALITRFLTNLGCDVTPHAPHRMNEGYGIHIDAVNKAHKLGCKLFISCDCGTSAIEQIKFAKSLGMNVVVLDHHAVGEELPPADAIVNPHRKDSEYPFSDLCGAGVVYKLCQGLTEELDIPVDKFHRAFLDLVVLGTVADVVPLVDENRVLTKFGLKQLSNTQKIGLRALIEIIHGGSFPTQPLKSFHIGYRIGPRLNAVGRIDASEWALDLLIESNKEKAYELAQKLEEINEERRSKQTLIYEEALEIVHSNALNEKPVMVVAKEGWHPGIIGIVASRLTETFYRPTFMVTIDSEKNVAKGSARSIPGFHLAEAIHASSKILISGGGHELAAGFSLEPSNLAAFEQTLIELAASSITPEMMQPSFHIDSEVSMEDFNFQSVEELELLEPYGAGNPMPIFSCRNLTLVSADPTKNPEHCKLWLQSPNGKMQLTMAFGYGQAFKPSDAGQNINVVFQPHLDEYMGRKNLKWNLKDFKYGHLQ